MKEIYFHFSSIPTSLLTLSHHLSSLISNNPKNQYRSKSLVELMNLNPDVPSMHLKRSNIHMPMHISKREREGDGYI